MIDGEEYTPQEKAAYIAWKMAQGESFSTKEVAEAFSVTYNGAYSMLTRISRVVPIAPSCQRGGRWQRIK